MPLSLNAQMIYDFLLKDILPNKKIVTYGVVSNKTGVPLGDAGEAVRLALYEIFQECDRLKLPPLSSIVVQETNLYDPTRRHGMPGGGYLSAEAQSSNDANRQRDTGWQDWKATPRPPDTDNWRMRSMIEAHQNSVWDFIEKWPDEL